MRVVGSLTVLCPLDIVVAKDSLGLTLVWCFLELSKNWAVLLFMVVLSLQVQKTHAQSPDWIWAKGFGASRGFGDTYGVSVAVSQGGDVYTTGSFIGNIDFDPGPGIYELNSNGLDAIFISKLDNDGVRA